MFDVIRHPVLKTLDPKDILRFMDARQEYELEVVESCEEVPKMTAARQKNVC